MSFCIVLSERSDGAPGIDRQWHFSWCSDLNLGRVLACLRLGRDEYNLTPFSLALIGKVTGRSGGNCPSKGEVG